MTLRSFIHRLWYEFVRILVLCVFSLLYHIRYTGRENIPRQGSVLLVSNHQSHLDPPLVGAGCPRHMNYMARSNLFHFAPFRWIIRSMYAFPIDIHGLGIAGFKESLRRLKRGEMLVIFPEGARTFDGQIAPFQPGFLSLAIRTRSPILPTAIEGAFSAWPRVRKFPQSGVINVHYGEPILPEQFGQFSEEELAAEVEHRVHALHAELCRRPVFARR